MTRAALGHFFEGPTGGRLPSSGITYWIATAAVIGCVLVSAWFGWQRISDRSYRDYGENTVVAAAERLNKASRTSDWATKLPVTITPYGPGYYWAITTLADYLPQRDALFTGRVLALTTTWLVGVAAAALTFRSSGQLPLSAFTALLLMQAPVITNWGTLCRADVVGAGLTFIGYTALYVSPRRLLPLAATAVACASLVKQSYVLAVIPMCAHLVICTGFRVAIRFAIWSACALVAAWGAVIIANTDYYRTIGLLPVTGRYSVRHAVKMTFDFLETPFSAIAVAYAWMLALKDWRAAAASLYWIAAVGGFITAGVLTAKEGANTNYFTEASILFSALIGTSLPALISGFNRSFVSVSLIIASVLLIAPELHRRNTMDDSSSEQQGTIMGYLAVHADGYPLTDGRWIGTVLDSSRLPAVNDPYAFRVVTDRFRDATAPVVKGIASGAVPIVILEKSIEQHMTAIGTMMQMWPADVLDAMAKCYSLEHTSRGLFIYVRDGYRKACSASPLPAEAVSSDVRMRTGPSR